MLRSSGCGVYTLLSAIGRPRPSGGSSTSIRYGRARLLWLTVVVCCLAAAGAAQSGRMGIEATLDLDPGMVASKSLVRVLRKDSTIAKTVYPHTYADLPQFVARLTPADGFSEGDPILFRVVLSPADSFLARVAPAPLLFHAISPSEPLSAEFCTLFRNHPPQFRHRIPDTTVNEGETFRYAVFARDIDADTVAYAFAEAPAGAAINSRNGRFVWTPSYDDSGAHRIVILADDGYEKVAATPSVIQVRNVNRPPVIVGVTADTMVMEGDTLRVEVSATDSDGDGLKYMLSSPVRRVLLRSDNGRFAWIPGFGEAGRVQFDVAVSDGRATTVAAPFTVRVLHVNRPPQFLASCRDTTIFEGDSLVIAYTAFDPDMTPVRYYCVNPPEGMAFSAAGILSWRPTLLQAGTYSFAVIATDDSLHDSLSVTVHVKNLNRLPAAVKLLSPASGHVLHLSDLGSPVRFSWTRSSDPDEDDTLSYLLQLTGPSLDTVVASGVDTIAAVMMRALLQANTSYRWLVVTYDGHAMVPSADTGSFVAGAFVTAHGENLVQRPQSYSLEQNFPNPFNPLTSIRFTLPSRSFVRLAIFNMLGERMVTLVAEEKEAGIFDISFDASAWPSGVYMFKMEAHPLEGNRLRDFISTKKMILVK